jgi:hypothetical protein
VKIAIALCRQPTCVPADESAPATQQLQGDLLSGMRSPSPVKLYKLNAIALDVDRIAMFRSSWTTRKFG